MEELFPDSRSGLYHLCVGFYLWICNYIQKSEELLQTAAVIKRGAYLLHQSLRRQKTRKRRLCQQEFRGRSASWSYKLTQTTQFVYQQLLNYFSYQTTGFGVCTNTHDDNWSSSMRKYLHPGAANVLLKIKNINLSNESETQDDKIYFLQRHTTTTSPWFPVLTVCWKLW